ncbi:signal transduction histidine kinase [Beggiatoa alba B18LD]|uniref:histidine kinase n=1 Tax=Beggiatoa alba B18LD TaxID=395493 RepID=I3CC08_9GAMM|nr:ATP-binding protein [Beggiatoa alba]EIJ41151.1 signal transduction histidine kinase [Beggiatoa alba B18LD]
MSHYFRQGRLLILILFILLAFLTIAGSLIATHQKSLLMASEQNRITLELDLISGFIKESFLQRDYNAVSLFLSDWGQQRAYIVSIKAILKNDFELVHYQRDTPAAATFTIQKQIQFSATNGLMIEISTDLADIQHIIQTLNFQLFAIALLIVAVLGVAIWVTLRKIALIPMEQEIERRTQALREMNQDLQVAMQIAEEAQHNAEEAAVEAEEAAAKAEIANQAKSIFLANMSHELRTPLNGILGYTQILQRDTQLSGQQKKGVDVIHRCGNYLLTLINDILDLSKIEADKLELYCTDVDFNVFLDDIVALFHARAEQKGIMFIFEHLTALPVAIYADEKRLRQILINLLGNAVKFTEQGGVKFKVAYQANTVFIEIEDTGIGIPHNEISDIFLPFYQVCSITNKIEGAGLGLTITKRLVELMHGHIRVESELHKGTHFWLELPLPERETLVKSVENIAPVIKGYEGEKKVILIVDDRWENRVVLVNLLQPLGFLTIEAINGQDGLHKMALQRPDLIITDLVMPVMDGFEFTRRVHHDVMTASIPIIATSASVFEHPQEDSTLAGCNAFLAKPIQVNALFDLLKTHLKVTWIYATSSPAMALIEQNKYEEEYHVMLSIPTDLMLSIDHALELCELAKIGDINRILSVIDTLDAVSEQHAFWQEMRNLAHNFETDLIYQLLRDYVDSLQVT